MIVHRKDIKCDEFLCLPEKNPSHYCEKPMPDHLTKLHDSDPARFVELTRELIKVAMADLALSLAEGWDKPQWSKVLAAFDAPAPTYCEKLLEQLKAEGCKEALHDDASECHITVKLGHRNYRKFIPPESQP